MTSESFRLLTTGTETALTPADFRYWKSLPALHQPDWNDHNQLGELRGDLANLPSLVAAADITALQASLAEVASGKALVVQAGDCAEDPAECKPADVRRKIDLLHVLAGALEEVSGLPVLRIGRIAGQFAKPRSNPTERVGDQEIPVYRGHLINGPEPTAQDRRPDPRRLIGCYDAAANAVEEVNRRNAESPEPMWVSHEALLLDYELPLLRVHTDGRTFLSSTHFPWIGERTRQTDGAHVRLLATVANPIACKVGPTMAEDDLLRLCEILDPDRIPGRLTLISRMGADMVAERLPSLVAAVRDAGHPVIWLTDPMHGNTVSGPGGLKTRFVPTILREVSGFQAAVAAGGGVAGGLHLETTPNEVTECVRSEALLKHLGDNYTSLCDPRLNPGQALEVVSGWQP